MIPAMTDMDLSQLKCYDITPLVWAKTAVFPGDVPFERSVSMDMQNGDHLGLSSINTTVHIGAHTDAPNHYAKEGVGISEVNLDKYLGACQVVEVNINRGERILPDHVGDDIQAKRILFKTGSFPDPDSWNDDFNSLSPELITWLKEKGVMLVGIDTPSVDPFDDKVLESHNAIFKTEMGILEGIVLNDVSPGLYQLVSLPLKIKDCDASPVRAVLLERS